MSDPFEKVRKIFATNDLRTLWKGLKTSAVKGVDKDEKKKIEKLYGTFDKGLGPLLDQWSQELAKFPDQDQKKIGQIGAKVQSVMADYKKKIDKSDIDPKARIGLSGGIDYLARGMMDQLKKHNEYAAKAEEYKKKMAG